MNHAKLRVGVGELYLKCLNYLYKRKHVYIRFFNFTGVDGYINSFIEVFLGFYMNGMSIFDILVENKFYKISTREKVCGGRVKFKFC